MSIEDLPTNAFHDGRLLRDGTWVVEFVADWCPFCRRFRPEFATLEGTDGVRLGLGDVTSFDNPWWDEFHLEVVPVAIVFRDGQAVFRVDSDPGLDLPPGTIDRLRSAAVAAARGG